MLSRRSIRDRYGQYPYGRRVRHRLNHHLQCRMRTLRAATLLADAEIGYTIYGTSSNLLTVDGQPDLWREHGPESGIRFSRI